jgi:hypothetical protein
MLGKYKRKRGANSKIITIPVALPSAVKIIASWALPFISISCPGRIERALLSSSGAPRKILGIKSINVWVIESETMNIIIDNTGRLRLTRRNPEIARIPAETRFMCIPGHRPVKHPMRMPKKSAKIEIRIMSSIVSLSKRGLIILCFV